MYRIQITRPEVVSTTQTENQEEYKKLAQITWNVLPSYAKAAIVNKQKHSVILEEESSSIKIDMDHVETNVYVDGKLAFNVKTEQVATYGQLAVIRGLQAYETKQHVAKEVAGEYIVMCITKTGEPMKVKIHKALYQRLRDEKKLHTHFKDVITIIVGEEIGDSYTRVETLNIG